MSSYIYQVPISSYTINRTVVIVSRAWAAWQSLPLLLLRNTTSFFPTSKTRIYRSCWTETMTNRLSPMAIPQRNGFYQSNPWTNLAQRRVTSFCHPLLNLYSRWICPMCLWLCFRVCFKHIVIISVDLRQPLNEQTIYVFTIVYMFCVGYMSFFFLCSKLCWTSFLD